MRERVNRLARGVLNEDQPVLIVKPERIELSMRRGEVLRTTLQADSGNGIHLKGLAWSDSIRVRVLRSSFGGKRNQIVLEADGRNLDAGAVIAGKLSLVTNGGEKTVPFEFRVEDGIAGNTLSNLQTIDDFLLIAKAEPESALRIFEYRDFVSAPFMKDLKLRALYDAFRSGPDRASAMEEFLVAAGAKKPALVRSETERCEIVCGPQGSTDCSITLVRVREGHVSLTVRAEGNFFRLPKRSVMAEEFRGSSCVYSFGIDPKRLHEGRNEGRLTFSSHTSSFSVPVTAWKEDASGDASLRERRLEERKHYAEYLDLRVRYEAAGRSGDGIPEQMIRELRAAGSEREEERKLRLLEAEASWFAGKTEQCRGILQSLADTVRGDRQSHLYEYLLFEALRALLPEGEERRESTVLLLRKFLEEEKMHELLPLYLMLRPELEDRDPVTLKLFLHEEYVGGSRSPFLYAAFARLYEKHPNLISGLGSEELAVLRFSLNHGMPGKDAAAAYTAAAADVRNYTDLHCRMLSALYSLRPSRDLLTAVCTSLIRRDLRTEEAHRWYLKGVSADIRLTSLNEYVVYSMPGEQKQQLPHEVLLYFAYDNRLDDRSRSRLYENLCRFRKKEPVLWNEYQDQILEFTLDQLLKGRVNRHLAVLYREVLCREMVDKKLATVLPAILNARRVSVDSSYIRSLVLVSPELKEEEKFRLDKGVVYAPVQTDDAVFLFEDSYGNRFADIPYRAEQVCEMPELLDYCEELVPEGPHQILKRLRRIADQGENAENKLPPDEVRTILNALEDGKLADHFSDRLLAVLLDHPQESILYLSECGGERFLPEQRKKLLQILVEGGRLSRAWELMSEYLIEDAPVSCRKQLCTGIILEKMFPEDELLLKLTAGVFFDGEADPVLLDYLCERFNGSTEEMYRLFREAEQKDCGTYDLEERLLAQMLFTGSTEHLDEVFQHYHENQKYSEVMVRAYITEKSAEYVLEGREPAESVFLYLETLVKAASDTDRIPVIYRLALTRYYASLDELDEGRKELAEQILLRLLDEGLSFPYYKNLARFIPVPEEILDRESVEFRGKRDGVYEIHMRILPDETEFRTETMRNMYLDLFVHQEILFAGETWEYEIRESGRPEVLLQGSIQSSSGKEAGRTEIFGGDGVRQQSRFACLNSMTKSLAGKDERSLRAEMEAFAAQEDLAAELFRLV